MAAGSEIVAWKKACREQGPIERDDCPVCGWTIEKHPKTGVLHCPWGHWQSDGLSTRVSREFIQ